jgi:hypothetical protein
MPKIKQLRVKHVRGIVDGPPLNFDKDGVILCGANGTGKSSFVDAIEKILTGKCRSLDIGDQSVSWKKHGAHINGQPPEIELVVNDAGREVVIKLDEPPAGSPPSVELFLQAAQQQAFVLRRRALLDFIDAKPADKYKIIQRFLELDRFTAFETDLKALQKEAQSKASLAAYDADTHMRNLREQLKLEAESPVTDDAILKRANALLSAAGVAPMHSLHALPAIRNSLQSRLGTFGDTHAWSRIEAFSQGVNRWPDTRALFVASEAWADACRRCQDEEMRLKGHFYAEVLERGATWIEADALERCPLCDNPIDRHSLVQHVQRRLDEHHILRDVRQQVETSRQHLLVQISTHITFLRAVKSAWLAAQPTAQTATLDQAIEALAGAEATVKAAPTNTAINLPAVLQAIPLDALKRQLLQTANDLCQPSPDLARYESLMLAGNALIAIEAHRALIEKTRRAQAQAEQAAAQLSLLVAHAERARKATVQAVIDQVAAQADDYFQRIHPGERIGGLLLRIKEAGAGSLTMTGTFYGNEADPRGFYSEGHVDSAGLCLFLAIRRLHHTLHPELALLVLDDVMHSVDGEHRRATADLIFEQFGDHQIMITTHDPIWFEQLKTAAWAKNRKLRPLRIATWSVKTGPVWGDHRSDVQWLRSPDANTSLPADRVIRAGRVLEEMGQILCNNLNVSVPFRRDGRYTIDPLWSNFKTAALKHKAFATAAQGAGDCINKIEQLRAYRNWVGAHWNEWAQQLTPAEADAFAGAVMALHGLVFCAGCGEFIQRIGSIEGLWSCRCESRRYK